jgi:putative transcriptional regulator
MQASEHQPIAAYESMRRKRNLFNELMEGFNALADQRAGKGSLRRHAVKQKRAPKIT